LYLEVVKLGGSWYTR